MPVGAILTLGDDNAEAAEGLAKWVIEIRIEQSLSKPTKFAVRFEDDVCGDKMALPDESALAPGQTVAILVKAPDDALQCLVRGPITKVKNSAVVGGATSWFEIHGEDERRLLDRVPYRKEWTGLASSVITGILGAYSDLDVEADVETTTIEYDAKEKKLTQNGTDLALIDKIAKDNSFEVWLSYDPTATSAPAVPGTAISHEIKQHFHVKRSPEQGSAPPDALPKLVPDSERALRVNVVEGQCSNVTKFDLDVDAERATRAYYARTGADGETVYFDADDDTQPLNAGATPVLEVGGETRTVLVPEEVPEEERALRARAILSEEGWFVKATCSTSAMLFGAPIQPHQVVPVEGVAAQHVGAYQVTDVLHVINYAGHLMDLKLRRNEINLPESNDLGAVAEALGA